MNRNLIIVLIVIVLLAIVAIAAKPADIKPLPNPDWERIRRAFAYDFKWRGWQQAYRRFLLETNPNQPGSASVEAIDATYRAIFREVVDNPQLR